MDFENADMSTPRVSTRRKKRTRYMEDFDYNPGDEPEIAMERMRIQSRTQASSAVSVSSSPKTDAKKSAKTRPQQNRTPVTVPSTPTIQLPSQLSGGVMMAPLIMQATQRGLAPSQITAIPLNCPVSVAGLRPITPSPITSSSTICSPSGGSYMLVTVSPDGQSISRKFVTLPPNVVFRVVPMPAGATTQANQTVVTTVPSNQTVTSTTQLS